MLDNDPPKTPSLLQTRDHVSGQHVCKSLIYTLRLEIALRFADRKKRNECVASRTRRLQRMVQANVSDTIALHGRQYCTDSAANPVLAQMLSMLKVWIACTSKWETNIP